MNTTDKKNSTDEQLALLKKQAEKTEKMATLGMLTAGIAHEIRNPLNFVINFAKLSKGPIDDLNDDIEECSETISDDTREDIEDITDNLLDNLNKILSHAERAMSIVMNTLQYSRGKDNVFIPTDICALVKEYVWLSFHSMRANLANFNLSIKEDYQEGMPLIKVVPQDLSRAVLNIMNNSCYAVWEKAQNSNEEYKPTIEVKAGLRDMELEITITDNGIGMNEEVKQRVFENFYTTKPLGQGTGLGMSIVRDIVEQTHHGRIEFDSEEGLYTTFSIFIPINQ